MEKYKLKDHYFTTTKNNKTINLFISKKLFSKIPKSAFEQLEDISLIPEVLSPILAMPDIHTGFGVPIGSVFATNKQNAIISSEAVGYDINCGVRLIKTNLFRKDLKKEDLHLLANNLKKLALGLSNQGIKLSKKDLDEILLTGINWAIKNKYALRSDKQKINYSGFFKEANIKDISKETLKRAKTQVGTLGQGNHFIDIVEITDIFNKQLSSKLGLKKSGICIFLHTGSRGLGHQIATDFNNLNKKKISAPLNKKDPNKKLINYFTLKSKEGKSYYHSMLAAGNYAFVNRSVLSSQIQEVIKNTLNLGQEIKFDLLCDISHNLATLEKIDSKELLIHRKGASRVFLKEELSKNSPYKDLGFPILLPGSMLDYSYVLIPDKGSKKTFFSVAHGAGRALSRSVAKQEINFKQLNDFMKKNDIILAGRSENLMREEQPNAYKASKEVVESMVENKLVKKVLKFKPIIVLTG